MFKNITTKLLILTLAAVIVSLVVGVENTFAVASGPVEQGVQAARGQGQPTSLFGSSGIFTTVTNTLLYIVGALSVVMIIYGGLRYVVSGGNSSAVTAAKNTILYAVVGLVVSILSYAIINFLLTTMLGGDGGGGGGAGWSNL